MLVEKLFEIEDVKQVENKLSTTVEINAKNKIFEGHFPNNPITPGVIQVQLVKEILEKHFNKSLKLSTMDRCKFVAILNPETNPVIDVEITVDKLDDSYKIKASGKDASNTYFKFSALYL